MSGWDHKPTESELMMSLSGELLVAAELLRREYPVLLTFGGAKKWDVVVRTEKTLFRVEVVVARDLKWRVSGIQRNDYNFLVFVWLPREYTRPAEYFVLTKSDFRAVVEPKEKAVNDARKKSMLGSYRVNNLEAEDLEPYRSNWDGIAIAAGLPRHDWTSNVDSH